VGFRVEEVEVAHLGVVVWAVEGTEVVLVDLEEGWFVTTVIIISSFLLFVRIKWIVAFQRTRHGYERTWRL
jgi:hypothetical protein